MRYSIEEICQIIGATTEGVNPQSEIDGYSIDSRSTLNGELFFAVRGENLDGHDFVEEAIGRGAIAAVVRRDFELPGTALMRCDDPLEGLHQLASHSRQQEDQLNVVGITGSCGKTTTKDLAAALLGRQGATGKNSGNLNNLYGLPLALLRRQPDLQTYVCEMGMSFPGELLAVTRIAQPDVAVYTNIYGVHMMNFQSVRQIAKAKAEMLEGVPRDGTVVANADDPEVMRIAESSRRETVTFSMEREADLRAGEVIDRGIKGLTFELRSGGRNRRVKSPLPGIHNLQNLLAALGAGLALGHRPEDLFAGLEDVDLSPWRTHIVRFKEGWTLYDDAYNSNPKALRLTMTTVVRSKGFRRRVAVLGDMLELGNDEVQEHLVMGAFLFRSGVDLLIAVGPLAGEMAEGAIVAGMKPESVICTPDSQAALTALEDAVRPGDLVLVKGSRGVKMETIVAGLTQRYTPLASLCGGEGN